MRLSAMRGYESRPSLRGTRPAVEEDQAVPWVEKRRDAATSELSLCRDARAEFALTVDKKQRDALETCASVVREGQ